MRVEAQAKMLSLLWLLSLGGGGGALLSGCRSGEHPGVTEYAVRGAIDRYVAQRTDVFEATAAGPKMLDGPGVASDGDEAWLDQRLVVPTDYRADFFSLGTAGTQSTGAEQPAATQPVPSSATFEAPAGYWRKDGWHQAGHELKQLATRDFWRGFKTSFWDLENALLLTATMGASITIRETGVDDTIRNRTHGSRAMGDMDETVQILGHPGTHFAGAGVLWLTSTLTRDVKSHEVAKTLTQALAVNGVTTLLLKVAANTRAPDDEPYAWPSGHTSSAFTVAAVLNEYYGPWVGLPSLALAGLVGFQRLDSRVHDFSDVVFGGMLGYVVGTSIARDGKAQFPELFGMKVVPYLDPETGSSGLALYKAW